MSTATAPADRHGPGLKIGMLVRVNSGPWEGALALVIKWTDGGDVWPRSGDVWLRIGNGVVVTLDGDQVDPVEYRPGSACPCSFAEELRTRP